MSDPAYDYKQEESRRPLNLPPLVLVEQRKWTYKEYKDWELKPGERYELINGVAYAMSAPNIIHQSISMLLSGEFYSYLKSKTCQVFAAPFDVRLFYEENESDKTVVQPDLIVVCDPKKLGFEGCRGAPDLVIEILSPSNGAIYMRRKIDIYMKAGVPEIWIVDPEEKQVDVYLLQNSRYVLNKFIDGDTLKSAQFPDFELPLDVLFAERQSL